MAAHQPDIERLLAEHRSELELHCYRMLGSLHDAEDAVQDTLLNAWRGIEHFEGRSSVRRWLYRIATNASLRLLERRGRSRRMLPALAGPAVGFSPLGPPNEGPWLEPYPEAELDAIDPEPGPDARYERREATSLAFLAAIQQLPPRQRASLLLRDVIGFSAAEAAEILGSTAASVNSALQRARETMATRPSLGAEPTGEQEELLQRYLAAWEAADIGGFVELLAEDATWSMPPWREWYAGRDSISQFMGWIWDDSRPRRHRVLRTGANGQPAFGYYRSEIGGGAAMPWALQVLELRSGAIASVTNFVYPDLFKQFGLPGEL